MMFWRRSQDRRRGGAAEEAKDSAGRRLAAVTAVGRPQWTPRDYLALATEGFGKNPVAYRCVRMIAEAAASVRLVVFEGGERATEHPLQQLLERPNPEQSGGDLLEAFYGALQTAGNGYLEAAGDPGSSPGQAAPEELWTLRPDRMAVVPGARGWPEAYEYSVGGRKTRLSRRADGWLPVLHLKLFHPADDWYGFSPLEAAAFAVDVHNASGAWNKALLDNAARPSGALVWGARDGAHMSEEQYARFKAELAETHAGMANAGRPLVLEGGLDWKPMSLTPADMDFVQGKAQAAREIALAFGVPPMLLGVPGDATYANYREANGAFWRQTIAPLVEKTARALTVWLGARFGPEVSVRPDLDSAPALAVEREALWARLSAAGWLTDDERRRMSGVGG
jgi:HK97 family phage portal protein